MSQSLLIVNADDCNLTPGVTAAILDCHENGILTSTTFMVNLPIESKTVKTLLKHKQLGIGIHLNITLGQPVSAPKSIKSLLSQATFKKYQLQTTQLPVLRDICIEYEAQIKLFMRVFGRKPTHLDTHHQLHDFPHFFEALIAVAKKFRLPIRRSKLMTQSAQAKKVFRSTDYFFGNLTTTGYWDELALVNLLPNLPQGIVEIMCHPGKNDSTLRRLSSFTAGREVEWDLFSAPKVRKMTQTLGIQLGHFGMCYY